MKKLLQRITKPPNIFAAMYPSFLVAKYFGLAPFKLDVSSDKPRGSFSLFGAFISAAAILSYGGSFALTVIYTMEDSFQNIYSSAAFVGHCLQIGLGFGAMIVLFLSIFVNATKGFNFLHEVDEIDKYLKDMKITISYTNVTFFQYTILVIFIVLAHTFSALDYFVYGTMFGIGGIAIFMAHVYPYVVMLFVLDQFTICVFVVCQRFVLVNRHLKAILNEVATNGNNRTLETQTQVYFRSRDMAGVSISSRTRKRTLKADLNIEHDLPTLDITRLRFIEIKLKKLFKLHDDICDLGYEIGKLSSVIVLTCLAVIFVIDVFDLFYCVKVFTSKNPDTLSLYLASLNLGWAIYTIATLIMVIFICDKTVCEAKRSANIVHDLLHSGALPSLREVLVGFSLQVLHREPAFTALGMFNIDFTLLYNICGASASYLLILIQFDSSNVQAEPAINVTAPVKLQLTDTN